MGRALWKSVEIYCANYVKSKNGGGAVILAIDPGAAQSAFVVLAEEKNRPFIKEKGILCNDDLVMFLNEKKVEHCQIKKMYIEMIASYGMPVGKDIFETCVWIGRFIEVWSYDWGYIFRKDIKKFLCGTTKAKDSNIRQRIIDIYANDKKEAVGTKKNPGPLYGVKKDIWAALAVGITALNEYYRCSNCNR